MNLNKLPVLIRTEVTAAAKAANLPAVYSRALVALEEAVNELSFTKLKTVEISVEGLAAWAKAHQDSKLSETARELKFRARRTANYIAEQLIKNRRAAFVARGGKLVAGSHGRMQVPVGEPESGGLIDTLSNAGYTVGEMVAIRDAGKVPDDTRHSQMSALQLRTAARAKSLNKKSSDVYYHAFSKQGKMSPFNFSFWYRNNNARGIARQLTDPAEIAKARRTVELTRAWCEEFLKNLPRTVSKAKT